MPDTYLQFSAFAKSPGSDQPAIIRVLLVDDHELVRIGFRLLLEATPGIEVVAEASSGEQALAWLRSQADASAGDEVAAEVVIMDMSMPGMSGIEATRQLLAREPRLRVLGLSAHEDPSHVRHLLRAGGLGYLSKRAAAQALIDAVLRVAHGERYVDAALAARLALLEPAPHATTQTSSLEGGALAGLSEREFEVFLHLARGQTVADIAAQLHISPRTVGTHLYHVKQKTGARNQAEITLLALQHQLLDS